MRGHTIICGYGRIGRILAVELTGARETFVVIDLEPAKVREAEADGHAALCGDASREDVLAAAGIEHAMTLATVLPDDAANVFITLSASGVNRGLEIIARAEDPATASKLRRSGATNVVMPAAIGAERIAHLVTRPGAHQLLGDAGGRGDLQAQLEPMGLRFEELRLPGHSSLIGRTLDHIEVRGNRGFLIVGIRHANGVLETNPTGDTLLAEGDTVIVLGHGDDLPELRRRYEFQSELTYRGARVR
jgi:voltage-gated potassium channel